MNGLLRNGILLCDRNTVAAFTGHRAESLPWGFNEADPRCIRFKAALYEAIVSAYREGKRVFLSGMATGTDIYAAEAVIAAKTEFPQIGLVCVFPCPSNDSRALNAASASDGSIILSPEYCAGCMLLRNRFLVENSSLLIACYDGRREGGTFHTLSLAQEKGLRITFVGLGQ